MALIVQGLAKILKIKWELHTTYRLQNLGKVECMNWTLKITVAKLCKETQSPWIDMLPLAQFRASCSLDPPATHPWRFSMADSLP
jgi:hypothetical protein